MRVARYVGGIGLAGWKFRPTNGSRRRVPPGGTRPTNGYRQRLSATADGNGMRAWSPAGTEVLVTLYRRPEGWPA